MNRTVRLIAGAVLSLAAFSLVELWPSGAELRCVDAMVQAGQIMEQAIQAIRDRREKAGARFDPGIDPNRTGLIGPEYTPLTTTVGELEAKRSTTNPNIAGYIVRLQSSRYLRDPGKQGHIERSACGCIAWRGEGHRPRFRLHSQGSTDQ
jgi:poly-gamma-glutamate system protein